MPLALPAAVVVLATMTGLLVWRVTVVSCQREAAEVRNGVLERLLQMRAKSLRALADMLVGR